MKKIFFASCALLLLCHGYYSDHAVAGDRYYLLNQGNIARDMGDLSGAAAFYEEYIKTHPLSSDNVPSRRFRKRSQYHLRNLLIAYDNLFDVLRDMRQQTEIRYWLEKLKSVYKSRRFGAKNTYRMSRILQENGSLEDVIPLLEDIIESQRLRYIPYNNKAVLRAVSRLMDIHDKRGDSTGKAQLCQYLDDYPRDDLDIKDRYRMALVYMKYNTARDKGEQILQRIVEDVEDCSLPEDMPTLAKSVGRLMELKSARHEHAEVKYLLGRCKLFANKDISPHELYGISVAMFKSGEKQEGQRFLERIINNYKDTVWARKSLFLLARQAMADQNWDTAIDAYATYIQRYPEQQFFALKAYSNMLDAYWSRDGDLEKQKVAVEKFADIINQVADYKAQLNLSRDLWRKGLDKLASATFQLGYTAAMKVVEENPDSIEAMRIRWQITKYATEIEKYDIAIENGSYVVHSQEKIDKNLLKPSERKKSDYYLSRVYLWLAKAHEHHADYTSAKGALGAFLQSYPGDSDADYVKFELGRLYEKTMEYDKAVMVLNKISDKVLKEKAQQRLQLMNARCEKQL